jgi:DcuC family C4-dicarboxylate transporter
MGGELLNPGAPELQSVVRVRLEHAPGVQTLDIVQRMLPLLAIHVAVAVPLFWWLTRREEKHEPAEMPPLDFQLNIIKALVPLLPVTLLFLTALPQPFRLFSVPPEWLMTKNALEGTFGSRLVGAAMLVGVLIAALTDWSKARDTGRVFFEGAGYALTHITSLIIAANAFGAAVGRVGLGDLLGRAIQTIPALLWPLAAVLPMGFSWVCGSGMASAESLYRFYDTPAMAQEVDPLRVGALVSLGAATGRTLSPVAAVVLMAASLTGASPLAIVRRIALPLVAGLTAATLLAFWLG